MLDRKEKEKIVKKYSRMMEGGIRSFLSKICHMDDIESCWQRVQKRYGDILDEAPDLGGSKNAMAMNFYQAAWAFALSDVLGRQITADEFTFLINEVMGPYLKMMEKIPGRFLIRNRVTHGLFNRYIRSYQKELQFHINKDWHNTWGLEIYHDVNEGVHFGLRGCPIHDYCLEHGCMNILPCFCNLDHRMLQTMHMFLIRPTTCSNGDEVCDYWIVAEDSEEVKKHPIVIKEDGLMINRAL